MHTKGGKVDTNKKIIGVRIKEGREAKKLSQKELAEHIDVTPSAVNQYEKGEKTPLAETLLKLAKVLDVSTDYLLGVSPEKDIFMDKDISMAFRDFKGLTPGDRANIIDNIAFLKEKAKRKGGKKQ